MSEVAVRFDRTVELPLDDLPATDAQLLARFGESRDDRAFEELVRRHGPMVLGVCRRVLADAHDAEDAFQATFLVLARKSSEIRDPELLGNWLYGVSFRIARKARNGRANSIAMPALESDSPRPDVEAASRELQSVIDEEMHRMPELERVLLTLAYFQGLTHNEIALRLEWPDGSVSRRMSKAQDTLRSRLKRRGVALSAGVLLVLLDQLQAGASVPPALIVSTSRAAVELGPAGLDGAIVPDPVAAASGAGGSAVVLWAVLLIAGLLLGSAGVAIAVGPSDASDHATGGPPSGTGTGTGTTPSGAGGDSCGG